MHDESQYLKPRGHSPIFIALRGICFADKSLLLPVVCKEGERVLSNQILQRTIYEIGDITECNCSIWNMERMMLAAVGEEKLAVKHAVTEFAEEFHKMGGQISKVTEELAMFVVFDELEPVYIFMLEHHGRVDAKVSGKLCVSQLESLIRMNKERMDKNRFIQNLLLDNLLLVDIYNQARKLSIPVEKRRVAILIEPKDPGDTIVLDMVKGIYTSGTGDYVTAVDEGHVILIKTLEDTEEYPDIDHIVKMLVDTVNTEAMVNVRVAYGTIIDELKDVSQSYKEAGMALDVGRIFYPERSILSYRELGIGRLIHQLPMSLCEMFLEEVFAGKAVDQFEEETLSTVDKFFENNLNISETARQLFVHRNTLVYRLEKIQKQTGLDVRVFDDALTFKIALMVADHMKFVREKE